MVRLCVIVLLIVVATMVNASGSSLINRWDIIEPKFEHENLNFEFHYLVSSTNTFASIKYTLFDGPECQEGAKRVAIDEVGPFRSSELQFNNDNDKNSNSNIKNQEHDDQAKVVVTLRLNPENIEGSKIYHPKNGDDGEGEIVFCVRLGLHTGDATNPDSLEVNFRETVVKLHVLLQDKFQVHLAEPLLTEL